jgi:hypothetical protein
MAAYWMILTVGRSVTSQPLISRYSAVADERWRWAAPAALGAVLVLGIVVAFGLGLLGMFVASGLGEVLVAIAICLPALLLRDAYRFVLFAMRRGGGAFSNQVIWSALVLAGLAGASSLSASKVVTLVLIWGGSAAVAAVAAAIQAGFVPRPTRVWDWYRAQRDIAGYYAGEGLVTTAAAQLYLYGIAAIGGIPVVASVRGAGVLLGPLQVAIQGAQLTAVPQGVDALRTSTDRLKSNIRWLAIVLVTLTALWGAAAVLLPQSLGYSLLGSTWPGAHEIIIPMTVVYIGLSLAAAGSVGLRAMAAAARSLRASAIGSGIGVVGGTAGSVFGASGAAWGLAFAALVQAVVFWMQFNAALRERSEISARGVLQPQAIEKEGAPK